MDSCCSISKESLDSGEVIFRDKWMHVLNVEYYFYPINGARHVWGNIASMKARKRTLSAQATTSTSHSNPLKSRTQITMARISVNMKGWRENSAASHLIAKWKDAVQRNFNEGGRVCHKAYIEASGCVPCWTRGKERETSSLQRCARYSCKSRDDGEWKGQWGIERQTDRYVNEKANCELYKSCQSVQSVRGCLSKR